MIRNGYENIRVGIRVEADASPETIEELIRVAEARSPLMDIISNPTPVSVYQVK
jgi:hypothetical protein